MIPIQDSYKQGTYLCGSGLINVARNHKGMNSLKILA